jgi:hypothetical protein
MDKTDLVFIPLIVGEASGVFAGFCPSWFTVSSPFFHDQEAKEGNIRRIRWGEVAATGIVVATGLAITYHTGSQLPLWMSVLTSGIFVAGYEYMIRHPATEDGGGLPPQMKTALNWQKAR